MGALDLATSWALVQRLDILQGLSGHLAVALLHVGGLLLGDGAEDGFPEIGEERGNGDGDGKGECEGEDGGRHAQGRGGEETKSHGGVCASVGVIMVKGRKCWCWLKMKKTDTSTLNPNRQGPPLK